MHVDYIFHPIIDLISLLMLWFITIGFHAMCIMQPMGFKF